MPTLGLSHVDTNGGWPEPEFPANTNNFDTSFNLKPKKFKSASKPKKGGRSLLLKLCLF